MVAEQGQPAAMTPPENFPVTWDGPSDAEFAWEREDMHFPHALAPLAGDYVRKGIYAGINYYFERVGLPMRTHCRIINGYTYAAEQLLVPESERQSVMERALRSRRAQAQVVRHYWDDKVLPTLLETYNWMRNVPIERAPLVEVAQAWRDLWQRLPRLYGLHFMTNAGSYQSLDELADLYESFTPGAQPSDALVLAQGLPHELQRVQRDLYLLAEAARSSPAVTALIAQDPARALTALPSVESGPKFLEALRSFLERHGHLGQPFDDLSLPSWTDEPSLVLAEVCKRLLQPEADPEVRRLLLVAEADALAEQVRARLRAQPDSLQQFEQALTLARDVGPLTEDHNYWLDRMLHAHVHRFAVRVGQRLVEANALAEARDIFFLHDDEIADALDAPRRLRPLVAERQRALERQKSMQPPSHLGQQPVAAMPPSRFGSVTPAQTQDGVLRGIGACKGTAHGPARVVLSPDDFAKVQRGDVLVCPSSNPTWVPLFGIVAGLVTNVGGVLSHAAVVAREFGVPAVVGTGNATSVIHDGQMLEVDGSAGVVRIVTDKNV